ncbi:glycerol-3-phosphate cytidylyltransferase [Vibrio parahaemolyticus]|uniref:Glycerol-3-phosphate cytidylyltransferase n=1 Tax=Vibrio parahaemolyticus TaxID=670 RepID=A0A7M1VZ24_VIBPH|nr:glycerol-3-phosphate cytidylyltransferase [Vibrio parahaemolyticus]EGR3133291.1 glycerol-3-phosphate cytidylyltransferase [Vibrio parahaemolyticus]EHU5190400.1 glycerol-3-phosphate cytidylyltransferase [Vibrio parahaemolyticus]EHY8864660.1 glycerol-3-phosphate cytidylyltransferase [Vibrio parahaemolyticus]EIA1340787.1 glycerol-3-phosphate cytidylyltransferase [Vibrio parahaemolyticus]EIA1766907.1 glycerol-3-phosphate cytidylyltransferase [Vibrio parahaemolyticus]
MKIVITYGTFDLFHVGHVRLLKRLKSLGDKLFVGISSDEFNEKKGKKSFFSYEERAEIVGASKYVDGVFPEHNWEQKVSDVLKYDADIFAMGDDWEGKFDFLNDYCQVIYIPRTENISTTDIKSKLSLLKKNDLDKIENSLHDVIEIVRTIS